MRMMQIERYAGRIERVLAHIERLGPAARPSLDELAKVAAISPYHFHRVWRLMTGETVYESLQRVQMGHALTAMKDERTQVVEAAEAAGFASGQSFARSLKAFAGASASELRSDPTKMAAFAARVERGLRTDADEARAMDVRIVELEPLKIVAMRNVGAYESLFNGYGALFELVAAWAGPEAVRGIHGVWLDDPATSPPEAFRFDCAFAVAHEGTPPAGARWEDAPVGPCLCMRHVGDYGKLLDAIDWLYGAALEAGLELRDAPLFTHYIDDPETTPEADCRTDIYLPIELERA